MIPLAVRWFAFKMIVRWAASWVAWWFARKVVLWLAERFNWGWLWNLYGKWITRSRSWQGEGDGPWEPAQRDFE